MENLVWTYQVTDDCTYSCDVDCPLVYESVEKLQEDIVEAALEAWSENKPYFKFLNQVMVRTDLYVNDQGDLTLPYVVPLAEWFQANRIDGG